MLGVMKPLHRDKSGPAPARDTRADEPSKLGGVRPMHVDYDEARSAEERGTYHQPRLLAQGEFFLDVHPVERLKALRTRAKRGR